MDSKYLEDVLSAAERLLFEWESETPDQVNEARAALEIFALLRTQSNQELLNQARTILIHPHWNEIRWQFFIHKFTENILQETSPFHIHLKSIIDTYNGSVITNQNDLENHLEAISSSLRKLNLSYYNIAKGSHLAIKEFQSLIGYNSATNQYETTPWFDFIEKVSIPNATISTQWIFQKTVPTKLISTHNETELITPIEIYSISKETYSFLNNKNPKATTFQTSVGLIITIRHTHSDYIFTTTIGNKKTNISDMYREIQQKIKHQIPSFTEGIHISMSKLDFLSSILENELQTQVTYEVAETSEYNISDDVDFFEIILAASALYRFLTEEQITQTTHLKLQKILFTAKTGHTNEQLLELKISNNILTNILPRPPFLL